MTRRIAIGQFHHVTNAFAKQRTGLAEFRRTNLATLAEFTAQTGGAK